MVHVKNNWQENADVLFSCSFLSLSMYTSHGVLGLDLQRNSRNVSYGEQTGKWLNYEAPRNINTPTGRNIQLSVRDSRSVGAIRSLPRTGVWTLLCWKDSLPDQSDTWFWLLRSYFACGDSLIISAAKVVYANHQLINTVHLKKMDMHTVLDMVINFIWRRFWQTRIKLMFLHLHLRKHKKNRKDIILPKQRIAMEGIRAE
jgi:hypothetical protein